MVASTSQASTPKTAIERCSSARLQEETVDNCITFCLPDCSNKYQATARALVHPCAAIDVEHMPGHVGRGRRTKKPAHLGDLVGVTEPSKRNLCGDGGPAFARDHCALDRAGRDTVDAHTCARQLDCERARQGDHAGLRSAVVRFRT